MSWEACLEWIVTEWGMKKGGKNCGFVRSLCEKNEETILRWFRQNESLKEKVYIEQM